MEKIKKHFLTLHEAMHAHLPLYLILSLMVVFAAWSLWLPTWFEQVDDASAAPVVLPFSNPVEIAAIPTDSKHKMVYANEIYYLAFSSTTNDGSAHNIYIATSTDGATWSSPQVAYSNINNGERNNSPASFDFAYNERDDYFGLAYIPTSTMEAQFGYGTSSNAFAWSATTTIDSSDLSYSASRRPRIAYATSAPLTLLAYERTGVTTSTLVLAKSIDHGGSFATSGIIDGLAPGGQIWLAGVGVNQVSGGPGTVIHVGYYTGNVDGEPPVNVDLHYASSSDNGDTWVSTKIDNTMNALQVFNAAPSGDASMTIDANGEPAFSYMRYDSMSGCPGSCVISGSVMFATRNADTLVWGTSTADKFTTSFGFSGVADIDTSLLFYSDDLPAFAYGFSGANNYPMLAVNSSTLATSTISESTLNSGATQLSLAYGTSSEKILSVFASGTGLYASASTLDDPDVTLTAPAVSAAAITNGATGLPSDVNAFVQFDAGLNGSTANTTNVTLKANTGNTQGGAPAGDNLCETVSVNTITISNDTLFCDHLSDGASLLASTWYTLTITTGVEGSNGAALAANLTYSFQTSAFRAGSDSTPPFVVSNWPQIGEKGFSLNGNIVIEFPQGDPGNMTLIGTGSATSSSNVVLQTGSGGQGSGSNICASDGCTFAFNATTRKLTINPAANLTANTEYVLTLSSSITNAAGSQLNGGSNDYILVFKTGSSADSTAPSVLDMEPVSSTDAVVERSLAEIAIVFSEAMDASTIDTSSVSIFQDDDTNGSFSAGNDTTIPTASTSLYYSSQENTLHLGMNMIQPQNKRICVSLLNLITDTVGNALPATNLCYHTKNVTYTAVAPTVLLADADNFSMWIEFDQPIDATTAVTKANYTIESPVGQQIALDNASFNYRPEARAVEVTNVGLVTGNQFKVTVTSVTERSGDATIVDNSSTNVAQGIVQNAAETGGFIGGFESPDFKGNTNFATFWESPEICSPVSRVTGATTTIECEFDAPAALAAGSQFILTIPAGFETNYATILATTTSHANKDINGFAPGTVTLTTIATNTIANTITLTTAGGTLASSDHVRFELGNIGNAASPGQKKITIITKDDSGFKQGKTISAQPFNLSEGGSLSISGTVCKGTSSDGVCTGSDTAIASAKVFCHSRGGGGSGSINVGHLETTADSNGDWSISGLTDGLYGCGIVQDETVFADVSGGQEFKKVVVSGSAVSNVDFKFADLSSTGKSLAVTITGGSSLSGEKVDIFCHAGSSDMNFSSPIFKVVTLDGDGGGSATVKLQGGKTYECGMGPHIDFAAMSSGGDMPIPTFTFMPPPMQTVVVPSDSDPTAITFSLIEASNSILGFVQDGNSSGIANAFVHARPLGCFDASTGAALDCSGGFSQSTSTGGFLLNVSPGAYEVTAGAPGMPESESVQITVDTSGNVTKNGVAITNQSDLILNLRNTGITISGELQDDEGNAINYGFVRAEEIASGGTCASHTFAHGHAEGPTKDGTYTLYVANGTWMVEGFAESYGRVGCIVVTVSGGTSATGQDIKATSGDFATISGTAPSGAFISAYSSNGGNRTVAASGSYSMKVTAGTGYTVDCFLHGSGPCGFSASVDASSDVTVNFDTSVSTGDVAVTMTGITDGFVDLRDSNGRGAGTGQNNSGVYTVTLPAGTYTLYGGGPKYGELCAGESVEVTAGQTTSVTCTAPTDLRTVSGRITDGSDNLAGASVKFFDSTNGRSFLTTSDATSGTSANFSVSNVPDSTYTIVAKRSGYEAASATATVSGGNLTLDDPIALTAASGANGATVTVPVESGSASYTGTAKVIATKGTVVIPIDIDKTAGSASVPLTNGSWTVKAVCDNGKESSETTVTISSGALVGSAPTLGCDTAISGYTEYNESNTISPKEGGLVSLTNIPGFQLNIPASTLSTSDSNTGNMQVKTDPTIAGIDPGNNYSVVGSTGYEMTPTDSSGNKIKELSGDAVAVTIPFTDAELTAAGVDESKLLLATLDANGELETFSTTVDTASNELTAQVTHFSSFVVVGAAASSDSSAGTTASTAAASGGAGKSVGVNPPSPTASAIAAEKQSQSQKTTTNFYAVNEPKEIEVGSFKHTVTLLDVTNKRAKVKIESDPITIDVKIGEVRDLDTNGDGIDDLRVGYISMKKNEAELSFTNLTDEVEVNAAVSINYGSYETKEREVTVSFNVNGAQYVALSNKANFEDSSFVPYTTTTKWTLSEGDGFKTVYVRFRSPDGGTLSEHDSIVLVGQGFAQSADAGCALPTKRAYKHTKSRAVWYVTEKCTKRPFKNPRLFFTYFSSWDEVQEVSESILTGIAKDSLGFMPWGATYDPGHGGVVKIVSDPTVYLLLGTERYSFASEAAFTGLKYVWTWVEDVVSEVVNKYDDKGEIKEGDARPSGSIIKYKDSPDVYKIEDGKKRLIPDEKTFEENKYRWDRIIEVDEEEVLEDGDPLKAPFTFTKTLKLGDQDASVIELQKRLGDLGHFVGTTFTDNYGTVTRNAVKAFQEASGLIATGSVDQKTLDLLNK